MKRGRKRSAGEFARIYGSRARVAFVQALPCIVCGSRPSENMHIKGDGVGRKADYRYIVPACDLCHAEAHQYGIKTFERRHHLNLECLAAATEERWQRYQAGNPEHVSSIVKRVMRKLG